MSMIDVSSKPEIFRKAVARGLIRLKKETLALIKKGHVKKGDIFSVAKVAGVFAAKNTCHLIPLCHPLPITNVSVDLRIIEDVGVECVTTVIVTAKTGVEMEALVGVTVALLTVWDMVKQYEKDTHGQYPNTTIDDITILSKEKREEHSKY